MIDKSMVGQDVGSPQQNPVPNQPRYAFDPFASAEARVSMGGNTTVQRGVGFGRKMDQDPFISDFDPNKQFKPKFTTDEDFKKTGEYDQYWEQTESDTSGIDLSTHKRDDTRLSAYKESGELTKDNIADVYSLKEDELEGYGIDIHAENDEGAPEGITSGWNDADGDGYDDDGHAFGTHGAVNVRTRQGEDSIWDVLNDPSAGLPGEQNIFEKGLGLAQDNLINPRETMTDWGDTMQTSPGIVGAAVPGLGPFAALGGALSARNLNKIHGKYGEYGSQQDGMGVIPKNAIPGVNTPLAVSEGFIGGTTVISGNTDLALQQNPQMDLNNDGSLDASELQDYMAQQKQLEEAQQIEDQRLRQLAEQKAQAAKAAQERREAKQKADAEAAAQEEKRRAEAQRRANESGREQQYGGGSAVTDRHGRAVRSGSDGSVVTSGGMVTVKPQRDDSGGGGGGDSCFSPGSVFRMKDGSLKAVEDIKVGDLMEKGGKVYGILQGDGTVCDWYRYGDSYVTGSHFVKERGKWMPVWKSKKAEALLFSGFDTWYCVLNTKHLMVAGDKTVFTDFDAVDSVNDELEERLNAVRK